MNSMSDSENDFQTSDYFSESTPKSCKSIGLDHKYARSPTYSLINSSPNSSKISFSSIESNRQTPRKQKLLKRRKLFVKECHNVDNRAKVIPLSERQQLAIALQLSSHESESDSHQSFDTNKLLQSENVKSDTQRVRRNHKGETGLHVAAIKGDLNQTKQIIKDNKYPVDITDFAGWSPIHEACNRGHIFIVEELLKAGSDVNARGYNNDTPLIDAAVNGHHHLVKLLLRYGADYTLTNNSSKTAIDVTKSVRVLEVINCFIKDKMRRNGIETSEADKDSNLKPSNGNSNMASAEASSPKVPPLRIVLPANSSNTTSSSSTSSNNSAHSSVSSSVTSSTAASTAKFPYVVTSEDSVHSENENSASGSAASQRITRSSQRVAQQQSHRSGASGEHPSDSEEPGLQNSHNDSQHPRKRKIRNNNETGHNKNGANAASNSNPDNDNDSSSSTSSVNLNQKDISPFALPQTNCYQMYLSIRKSVDKKRREMYPVAPKAPQGFADYMINRCSYLLASNKSLNGNESTPSPNIAAVKPSITPPPTSLSTSKMNEIFVAQEKERYKMKVQHLIERQKLVLSAEQEILRVHGRAARAMANQNVPFSVCSILKDEEIYNVFDSETEQNESLMKSDNKSTTSGVTSGASGLSANRTRYNGRLFLSWLQDVGDKWEKTKKVMLLRHKKESDSLLAMQRLEWEWKLKEFGLCDLKTSPTIDETYVPKVNVIDNFELPA